MVYAKIKLSGEQTNTIKSIQEKLLKLKLDIYDSIHNEARIKKFGPVEDCYYYFGYNSEFLEICISFKDHVDIIKISGNIDNIEAKINGSYSFNISQVLSNANYFLAGIISTY